MEVVAEDVACGDEEEEDGRDHGANVLGGAEEMARAGVGHERCCATSALRGKGSGITRDSRTMPLTVSITPRVNRRNVRLKGLEPC